MLLEHLPAGDRLLVEIQLIERIDRLDQLPESIRLMRENRGDLVDERRKVIAEVEAATRKDHGRSALRFQVEIVPAEPELLEQLGQRTGLRPGSGIVRDRVQTDVVVPPAKPVERVQAADRRMPLDDADRLLVVGQPDPGGEAGHAGTDDESVVTQGIVECADRETTHYRGQRGQPSAVSLADILKADSRQPTAHSPQPTPDS